MSRPTEQQLEQRRWSRARPGPRRFLRGPTWTMGDYSTSKQVSKQECHRFEAVPDPISILILIRLPLIWIRILPHVLHMLENPTIKIWPLFTPVPVYIVLSFSSVSGGVIIFNILDSLLKFSGKKRCCGSALVSMRIGIQLFISIRIRIQGAKPLQFWIQVRL